MTMFGLKQALEGHSLIKVSSEARGVSESDDMLSPAAIQAALDCGLTAADAKAIMREIMLHVGAGRSVEETRADLMSCTLAVGMYWGYFARVRMENDGNTSQ